MADQNRTPGQPNPTVTPAPKPDNKPDSQATQTDDQARRDGGKTGNDKTVSKEQIEKIAEKAVDHTKDEPGS